MTTGPPSVCTSCVSVGAVSDLLESIITGALWDTLKNAYGIASTFISIEDIKRWILGDDSEPEQQRLHALFQLTQDVQGNRTCEYWEWCNSSGIVFFPPGDDRPNQPPIMSIVLGPGLAEPVQFIPGFY